jgi:UDP-N-acetyl-D-glucosamine/UDP-N-acetyl-D-galactosamine dehydrogenase
LPRANNAGAPLKPFTRGLPLQKQAAIVAQKGEGTASLPALALVRIGIVGLGYVGLPLAVYLARHFPVTAFDIDRERVAELGAGQDRTREVTPEEFAQAGPIAYTADADKLREANFYIITVPTPVDQAKRPDLSALVAASEIVGRVLRPGDIVVYESTVFPGATEEVCVPVLEAASGLRFNRDFFAGYSPERINPGDRAHRLPDIVKVTSGSTPEAARLVDQVYAQVITAGTHRASSIRVAEAAKVIENIQRDVNIALFKALGLDTREVLEAAGTKWNFQPFRPGLVGGHCIGVDPYYMTHKAESIGFHPQMILAGRRINDGMAAYIANDVIKTMLKRKQSIDLARVLVMGFTFKENVADTRNTKVADLVRALGDFVAEVVTYDPMADAALAAREYGIALTNTLPQGPFDAIILAVKHEPIAALGEAGIKALLAPGGLIYDLKGVLPRSASHARI